MKKIILLFVILFSVSNLKAFECPTCSTYTWIQDYMSMPYGPCLITIYYSHKDCNPGKYLRIDKVVTSDDCILSQDMAIEYATRYLLNSSFEIFGIGGQDSVEFNLIAECCWGSSTTGGGPSGGDITTYEPCPEQDCCCESYFKIKKFVELGIEKRRYIDSKNQISDGTGTNCGTGCEKICDIFDGLATNVGVAPVYTGDCDTNCFSPWYTSGSNILQKSYGSVCNIEVYYQFRECGGNVEIKFSSIAYTGNDCGNMDDIMKEAIEGILAQVASHYTLPKTFQVRIGTCWDLVTFENQNFLKACYVDDCCIAEYQLIDDGSGGSKVQTSSTSISSRYIACGANSPCTFICNTTNLGITENQTLSKKAAREVNGNLFETTSIVIPNPATESITLKILSRFSGSLNITITDITGKIVFENNYNKTSEKLDAEINIKELTQGTYYYNIRAGIHDIDGGKFIKK